MQVLLQDLRYSFRQLINSRGFTLTALISLALGIGATTAVFSVIYATLMNPYPYPSANRIVRLTVDSKSGSADWANLNGTQIQQVRQLPVIEGVLAMEAEATVDTLIHTIHAHPTLYEAMGEAFNAVYGQAINA